MLQTTNENFQFEKQQKKTLRSSQSFTVMENWNKKLQHNEEYL